MADINQPDQEENLPISDVIQPENTPQPETTNQSEPSATPETGSGEEPPQDQPAEPVIQPSPSQIGKTSKLLIGLLIVVLLAVLGYLGYQAFITETPSANKVNQVTKKDVSVVKIGRIDGVANEFYPKSSITTTNFSIDQQLFEGLVQYSDLTKIKPLLATSWTTPSDNDWIFELRQDVKFHSGRTMTAEDVKSSLEKYSKDVYEGEFSVPIKEVKVLSANKVEIITTQPDPLLLKKLAFLYILDSKSTDASSVDQGTGPYRLKPGTTPSETELDLVAFDQYHGGHVYTKELKWTIISEEDKLLDQALKGNFDYIDGIDTLSNIDTLKQKSKLHLTSDSGVSVTHVGINHNKAGSPIQKLKVRQAIDKALDRNAIIQAADLKAVVASQVVPKDIPGYNPAIKATAVDLAGAKQLLTDAGYPNGTTLTLSFAEDLAKPQAENIAKQLATVGITVKLDPVTLDDLFTKIDAGKTELYYLSYGTDLVDASDPLTYNFKSVNYSNPQLDELLDLSGKNLDETKRIDQLKQASKVVMDDIGWIPLYSRTINAASTPSLVISRDNFIGPYFWQVYKQ